MHIHLYLVSGVADPHTRSMQWAADKLKPYKGVMQCVSSRLRDLFLIAIAAIIAVHPQAPTVQQLRYALFISGPEGEFDASGSVPAIELAEEYILKNKSVLDGYELRHSPVQDTLVGYM